MLDCRVFPARQGPRRTPQFLQRPNGCPWIWGSRAGNYRRGNSHLRRLGNDRSILAQSCNPGSNCSSECRPASLLRGLRCPPTHHPEWIVAICEDHRGQSVSNSLVVINSSRRTVHVLASGADFYAFPRFSPSGDHICWTQWNHPDMPWTGTELFVAAWADDGTVSEVRLVDGQAGQVSITQPRWGPDGTLFFATDRSGYWQLSAVREGSTIPQPIPISELERGEFAAADSKLGSSTFVPLTADTIIATWTKDAQEQLVVIDLSRLTYSTLPYPLTGISGRAVQRTSDTSFVVIAKTPTKPEALYHINLSQSPPQRDILKSSLSLSIPEEFYSAAEHITFPRTQGLHYNNTPAHAWFLPPKNPNYTAPEGTLPPLIVFMHGGPTSHVDPGLDLSWQYYTSRGFATALPNYAGSSGYGRAYRDLLDGAWGILDPADAASCVAYLVQTHRVDASRVAIVGGSSGGYAALQAIWMFPSLWSAAASLYGISDVEAIVRDTHKFESHYAFRLLFRDKVPGEEEERRRVYRERSPCFYADRIRAPVLFLQGTEDIIVPPNQTEMMARAVVENGGTAKVVLFQGEGHGFRGSESTCRAIYEQDMWWRKYLVEQPS